MNDLIRRQAAIDSLTIEYNAVGILGEQWAISQCIDAIKKLPGINPVKTGKWTATERSIGTRFTIFGYECSECEQISTGKSLYCPHCGSKMNEREGV